MAIPTTQTVSSLALDRVHQRMAGSNAVIVAESKTFGIVLDPSHAAPCNAVFTLRHADAPMLTVADTVDGCGVSLTAGKSYASVVACGVERARFGPRGLQADEVRVCSNLTVDGSLHAERYENLVDDYVSYALFQPPTANALTRAFEALSNLIVSSGGGGGGGGGGGWGGGGEEGDAFAEYEARFGDAAMMGALACADLMVAPGGSVSARSFCNLVNDFRRSNLNMPPTANALNAAYIQLSNFVTTRIEGALGGPGGGGAGGGAGGGCGVAVGCGDGGSGSGSNVWVVRDGRWQTDLWLQSSDGVDRVRYGASGGTAWSSPPDAFSSACFRWADGLTDLMSVSSTGDLHVAGAVHAGDSVTVTSNLEVGGRVDVADDVVIAGVLTAAAYSNLPVASGATRGVVALSSSLSLEDSNVAATAAVVRSAYLGVDDRVHTLQMFATEVLYAAYLASNVAAAASNEAYAYAFTRSYASNAMTTGLSLYSGATDAAGGVRAQLVNDTSNAFSISLASSAAASEAVLTNETGGALKLASKACALSVDDVVSVSRGRADQSDLPPDMDADVTTDPATGLAFASSASSVFSVDTWAQAFQGFSLSPLSTSWVSAQDVYDANTGAPTATSSSTALGDIVVAGEWLELHVSTPMFASMFFVQASSAAYCPDDFLMLGSPDGGSTWERLNDPDVTRSQSALVLSGGRWYPMTREAAARAFSTFRLVVPRVAMLRTSPTYPTAVQIDAIKIRGGLKAPARDALFVANDDTLVVSRLGRVGIREAFPSATLHVGNDFAPRTLVVFDKTPAVPNNHEFRGLSVGPSNLTYHVDQCCVDHVFVAGLCNDASMEVLRVAGTGRVGVLTAAPECALDVGGDVDVKGELRQGGRALVRSNGDVDLLMTDEGDAGLFVDRVTGYVGVGTSNPEAPLDVASLPAIFRGAAVLQPDSNVFGATSNVFTGAACFASNAVMDANLVIRGDASVQGAFVSTGFMYGENYNFYKNAKVVTQDASAVGYGFRINDDDQLELFKYSAFPAQNAQVYKTVALFGMEPLSAADDSDFFSGTMPFSTHAVIGAGGGGGGAAGTGGDDDATTTGSSNDAAAHWTTAGSFSNLTFGGVTRFAGLVRPATDATFDLGTPAARWRDVYLAGSNLTLGDLTLRNLGGGSLALVSPSGETRPVLTGVNPNVVGTLRVSSTAVGRMHVDAVAGTVHTLESASSSGEGSTIVKRNCKTGDVTSALRFVASDASGVELLQPTNQHPARAFHAAGFDVDDATGTLFVCATFPSPLASSPTSSSPPSTTLSLIDTANVRTLWATQHEGLQGGTVVFAIGRRQRAEGDDGHDSVLWAAVIEGALAVQGVRALPGRAIVSITPHASALALRAGDGIAATLVTEEPGDCVMVAFHAPDGAFRWSRGIRGFGAGVGAERSQFRGAAFEASQPTSAVGVFLYTTDVTTDPTSPAVAVLYDPARSGATIETWPSPVVGGGTVGGESWLLLAQLDGLDGSLLRRTDVVTTDWLGDTSPLAMCMHADGSARISYACSATSRVLSSTGSVFDIAVQEPSIVVACLNAASGGAVWAAHVTGSVQASQDYGGTLNALQGIGGTMLSCASSTAEAALPPVLHDANGSSIVLGLGGGGVHHVKLDASGRIAWAATLRGPPGGGGVGSSPAAVGVVKGDATLLLGASADDEMTIYSGTGDVRRFSFVSPTAYVRVSSEDGNIVPTASDMLVPYIRRLQGALTTTLQGDDEGGGGSGGGGSGGGLVVTATEVLPSSSRATSVGSAKAPFEAMHARSANTGRVLLGGGDEGRIIPGPLGPGASTFLRGLEYVATSSYVAEPEGVDMAWCAFGGNRQQYPWPVWSAPSGDGAWLQVKTPLPAVIRAVTVTTPPEGFGPPYIAPAAWEMRASSDDGATWTTVVGPSTLLNVEVTAALHMSEEKARLFRLVVLDTPGPVALSEIILTGDVLETSASPSVTWAQDPGTGVFRSAVGAVGIACAGRSAATVSTTLAEFEVPLVASDKLGVGRRDPLFPVHVEGHVSNVSVYASHDVVTLSDMRNNADQRPIEDALDRLQSITGYTYLGDAGGKRRCGLVAQELQSVLPEAVHTDPESGMLGVAYGNALALVVQAIKELRAEVTALAASVATLAP